MSGAPDLIITPPTGPLVYGVAPIDLRGFRINITLSRSGPDGNWSLGVQSSILTIADVAVNDRSFTAAESETIPGNEAADLAAVTPMLKELVDSVYNRIPTP